MNLRPRNRRRSEPNAKTRRWDEAGVEGSDARMTANVDYGRSWMRVAGFAFAALVLGSCASSLTLPNHLLPLPSEAQALLNERKMRTEQPIFIRVFKEESELEVWKQRIDGRFYHFRTYPICTWSGELGPKLAEGDRQSPEGFYTVPRTQMNPHSKFHLAFNLGFPNAFDRSHGRTGSALMVHGKCKSVGCYAITDPYIEEVYALAREAYIGGQEAIHVQAFPFRMTDANMARHATSPHVEFWTQLKAGYDAFEATRTVPEVAVCGKSYIINPIWAKPLAAPLAADRACPRFATQPVTRFVLDKDEAARDLRQAAPGSRLRSIATTQ